MKRLLSCAAIAATLLSGVSCSGYAISVGGGWKNGGPWAGVNIIPLPAHDLTGLPTLQQAGQALDAIASPYASSGKTHVSAPP